MTFSGKGLAALLLMTGLSTALLVAGAPASAQPNDLYQHPNILTVPTDMLGTGAAPAKEYCGPRGGVR